MARQAETMSKARAGAKPAAKRGGAKAKAPAKAMAGAPAKRSVPARAAEVHRLAGEAGKLVRLERSGRSRKLVAHVVSGQQARDLAAELHPPKVVPISGDDAHVIRCDWDLEANEYICDIIPADDPRATL